MTSDEVYKLVEDNGLTLHGDIEHFAALVAAAEREACITDIKWHVPRAGRHMTEYQMAEKMIARIRARGQE